jgi:hypothetical protein
MSLWLAGEAGQASLARTASADGLRAAVDQHAAEIRDTLGGRVSEGVLLHYARGFVEAAVARGWWPPHRRSPHSLGGWPAAEPGGWPAAEPDWESLRLAAVCRLFLETQGLALLPRAGEKIVRQFSGVI